MPIRQVAASGTATSASEVMQGARSGSGALNTISAHLHDGDHGVRLVRQQPDHAEHLLQAHSCSFVINITQMNQDK